MNPACSLCRGACCESLVVDLPDTPEGRFLGYHGTHIGPRRIELPTPCVHHCGECRIHATRPQPCRDYAVGGPECLATIRRRRTNWPEIQAIIFNTELS